MVALVQHRSRMILGLPEGNSHAQVFLFEYIRHDLSPYVPSTESHSESHS